MFKHFKSMLHWSQFTTQFCILNLQKYAVSHNKYLVKMINFKKCFCMAVLMEVQQLCSKLLSFVVILLCDFEKYFSRVSQRYNWEDASRISVDISRTRVSISCRITGRGEGQGF